MIGIDVFPTEIFFFLESCTLSGVIFIFKWDDQWERPNKLGRSCDMKVTPWRMLRHCNVCLIAHLKNFCVPLRKPKTYYCPPARKSIWKMSCDSRGFQPHARYDASHDIFNTIRSSPLNVRLTPPCSFQVQCNGLEFFLVLAPAQLLSALQEHFSAWQYRVSERKSCCFFWIFMG